MGTITLLENRTLYVFLFCTKHALHWHPLRPAEGEDGKSPLDKRVDMVTCRSLQWEGEQFASGLAPPQAVALLTPQTASRALSSDQHLNSLSGPTVRRSPRSPLCPCPPQPVTAWWAGEELTMERLFLRG